MFTTSSDDVLLEFSNILLHHICHDPKRVDSLGRDEIFMRSIFDKLKSHDNDILLHSIELLNIIMRNAMLIEAIMGLKDFPLKNLQIELKNEVEEIQGAAIESFVMITEFLENSFWDVLGSERFIEEIHVICMVRLIYWNVNFSCHLNLFNFSKLTTKTS